MHRGIVAIGVLVGGALAGCSPAPPMIVAPPPGVTASPPSDAPHGALLDPNRAAASTETGPPPRIVRKIPPAYPAIAREAGVSGIVIVEAMIGENGQVMETRVKKSIPMLDEAAVACVRQWQFEAARSDGVPIAAWVDCPVAFIL